MTPDPKGLLTTRVENKPNRARRRAVLVTQGQDIRINLDLRDEFGVAIDPNKFYEAPESSSSSSSSSIISSSSSIAEAVTTDPSNQIRVAAMEAVRFRGKKGSPVLGDAVYDKTNKSVIFSIPGTLISVSQILTVEVAVFNGRGIAASEQIYVWIDPSVFYADQNRGIFAALDEVRLQIRDSAPEDNHMLRGMEYDLAEICYSLVDALHSFNTAPPPINSYLYTDTFTMSGDVMNGILANLYQMSWEHRARNRLAYASGGVTVDDHWNYELYLKMAEEYQAKYNAWIKKTRKAANALLGWSSNGMGLSCGGCG